MPKSPSPAPYSSRRRWTVVEARAALTALGVSGLSLIAFAAREGLDPQRLRSWRNKLGVAAPPAFVEVRPRADDRVEIVLRSGVVVVLQGRSSRRERDGRRGARAHRRRD